MRRRTFGMLASATASGIAVLGTVREDRCPAGMDEFVRVEGMTSRMPLRGDDMTPAE
jgi:hypothetical protein